ncbi:MAG TPA: DUF4097 family beta strand repeat-containing protein [Phycisphaerales bacterium]|nr:DUF4097 family beta strand repeat-containing protein [Phycisphaerales bacterium]
MNKTALGVLIPALALGSVAVTAGCMSACCLPGPGANVTAVVNATAAHDPEKRVSIETSNGNVEVIHADTDIVTVRADFRVTSQERAGLVDVSTSRGEDGTLVIAPVWPDNRRQSNESCSLVVTMPRGAGLRIDTSNGEIEVGPGFGGSASLDTSNGSVTVTDFDGPLTARSSNGEIVLRDVGNCDAKTSNGSITVTLRDDATGPVQLGSSNGEITLTVGPAFRGRAACSTSNGSVSTRGTMTVTSSARNSAAIDFGDGPSSYVESSNGSITVIKKDATGNSTSAQRHGENEIDERK